MYKSRTTLDLGLVHQLSDFEIESLSQKIIPGI